MKTKKTKIETLLNDPANVRKHDQRNIDSIKASLARFGQQKPIVVNSEGIVIAGNGTLSAAKDLGWENIAVVETELDGVDATAYAIADNRTAELAAWYDEALAQTLASLQNDNSIDELVAGFNESEIQELIDGAAGVSDIEEDEVPEVPEKAITQVGDLWLLGEHRLLCGDSTSEDDVARLMDGEQIESVVTDPPYGIGANKQELGTGKKNFYRGADWDSKIPSMDVILELGVSTIVWGGNYFELPRNNHWLCWHKKNDGLSFSEFELAWTNLGKNCRMFSHHWSGEEKQHPTMKPLAVMCWCVGMVEGCNVYDPFMGSGTTLIACEQLNRKCYGVEIDPLYCDVIVKRWENLTGEKAVRNG